MSRITCIAVIAVSLLWTSIGFGEIKEGQWEITTKTSMKGMKMQMPATTIKQCVTKKDPVPQKQEKGTECKMTDQKMTGDTVTYTMECKAPDSTMISSGKMTYKTNTLNGTTNTTINAKGQPQVQMTSTMSGRYLGPCPK